MFRKFLCLIIFIFCFANLSLFAQSAEEKSIQVKFEFSGFRKPSEWTYLYGLMEFSPDNKWLAISGTKGQIQIYEVDSGKLKSELTGEKKRFFNAFSFSPDGKTALLQRAGDRKLWLFDVESGKLLREIEGSGKLEGGGFVMSNEESGLQMSPAPISRNWKNVLIGVNAGEYELTDFASGAVKYTFHHADKPSAIKEIFKGLGTAFTYGRLNYFLRNSTFSPDGKVAIIANGNNSPTIWNVETGNLIAKLEPQTDRVYRAFFDETSRFAITSNNDGITSVWEAETGKMISSFGNNKHQAYPHTTSPDSQRIVTSNYFRTRYDNDRDAQIWDLRTGKLEISLAKADPDQVIYSPNGKMIATIPLTGKKYLAQIWDAERGALLTSVLRQKEDNCLAILWTPDSRFLLTSSKDNVKIWDVKGELKQTLSDAVYPINLSSDGKYLATGGRKDKGFVWEIKQN